MNKTANCPAFSNPTRDEVRHGSLLLTGLYTAHGLLSFKTWHCRRFRQDKAVQIESGDLAGSGVEIRDNKVKSSLLVPLLGCSLTRQLFTTRIFCHLRSTTRNSTTMAIDSPFYSKLAGLYQGGHSDWPWYCYAALVFQVNDQMNLVGETWSVAHESAAGNEQTQLRIARQLREAMLKASVLVGFPKGINAMTTLQQRIHADAPALGKSLDNDKSLRENLQRPEKDNRGKEFFSKVYAQHTDRVLHSLAIVSGGDLAEFAINAVYGDLMAEVSRLNARDTGLLEFLACYATAGTSGLQAKSHMYGSHNLGNTKTEILAVVAICDAIENEYDLKKDRPLEQYNWLAKAEQW
nr:uncharacterized protein c17d11.03c [Quercus suber]